MKPTAAQKKIFSRVAEVGCMACFQLGHITPCEIHHWREYGYRDHDKVFGLCPVHHKATSKVHGILNRHLDKTEFAAEYGTDEELYNICMELIKG